MTVVKKKTASTYPTKNSNGLFSFPILRCIRLWGLCWAATSVRRVRSQTLSYGHLSTIAGRSGVWPCCRTRRTRPSTSWPGSTVPSVLEHTVDELVWFMSILKDAKTGFVKKEFYCIWIRESIRVKKFRFSCLVFIFVLCYGFVFSKRFKFFSV